MAKPRLQLISPPHPYLRQPKAQAPLGILYVAASVREMGFPVGVTDLSDKHYKDEYDIPEAEVYGITGTILDVKSCHAVARFLKERDECAKVILGGPITLSPEHIDMKLFDSVVRREGEHVIMEVLRDYPRLKRQYVGKRIRDIDALPFPARDLLDGQLGGDIFANRKKYFDGGSTVFLTSRGCPFRCVFCASPALWDCKLTYRSPHRIAQEIDEVVERFGVRQFRISDENLTANQKHLEGICEHLKGKDIAWRASIRVRPNGVRMFRMMREAGCTEVCFGIESGDMDVLHALRKMTTPQENNEAIVSAKMAGLAVRILFMTGVPGETKRTVGRNIEFLESVQDYYDTIALTNFVPLPGTAVADEPEKCGCEILDRDIEKYNLCMFGADGERREWPNLVRPVGLTVEELTDNKRKMIEYLERTGRLNEG